MGFTEGGVSESSNTYSGRIVTVRIAKGLTTASRKRWKEMNESRLSHRRLKEMSIGEDRCTVCGSMRDKNSKYCRDCWKAMGRRYNPRAIGILGTMNITVAQKRRCLSCRILPKCIEADNIYDGCNTIFKSLHDKKAKEKMRLLARRIPG